jgi:hypothetical protein
VLVLESLFEAIVRFAADLFNVSGSAMRQFRMVLGAPTSGRHLERGALTAAANLAPKDINGVGGPPFMTGYAIQLVGQVSRNLDNGLLAGHAGSLLGYQIRNQDGCFQGIQDGFHELRKKILAVSQHRQQPAVQ